MDLTSRRWRGSAAVVAICVAGALGAGGRGTQAVATADPSSGDWPMFHHDLVHLGVSPDGTTGAMAASAGLHRIWRAALGSGIQATPAAVYNATLDRSLVYDVSLNGRLVALDASTGATVWSFSIGPRDNYSSPAIYGNTVYVGATKAHTMWAVDATTGQPICSYVVGGRIFSSPVVYDLGNGPVVFFGDSGLSESDNGGAEWAVNGVGNTLGQCTLLWSWRGWVDTGSTGMQGGSWSPNAIAIDSTGRPIDLFGSNQPDDSVYALDARDGSLIWTYRTFVGADHDVGAGATVTAPAVNGFADGAVYIPGKNGTLYCLDLATGALIWQHSMASSTVKGNLVSTPAVVGRTVYVGFSHGVWAFDAVTGVQSYYTARQWAARLVLASPAVSGAAGDQAIWSTDLGGVLTAYRLSTGAPLWHAPAAGGAMQASAVVSDGLVLTASMDGYVYAYSP